MKQQEVSLSDENLVLSEEKELLPEKEEMLFEKTEELSEEEMKACKKGLIKRENKTNKEIINFLKRYINKNNNGIRPQYFQKKAHLGENTFRDVFSQKRKLSRRFKKRICLGIGIIWKDIVHNQIDRLYPKQSPEKRQERVQKLRNEFIWHLGTPMKEVFEMIQEGEKLEPYAIYMNRTSGKKDNFTKNN